MAQGMAEAVPMDASRESPKKALVFIGKAKS
jgi:hypothetical protein